MFERNKIQRVIVHNFYEFAYKKKRRLYSEDSFSIHVTIYRKTIIFNTSQYIDYTRSINMITGTLCSIIISKLITFVILLYKQL